MGTTTTGSPTSRARAGRSSTLRNVVAFCLMLALSAFGYELVFLILTVHVYDLTHRAFSVGVFTAITFLPKMFSPVYGVLVDRYDGRWILAVNAGLVGVLVFALGVAEHVTAIYVLWFVATIFIMFINTARAALMTVIMPAGDYVCGNSVILAILNAARIGAPALAGLVMRRLDEQVLMLVASGGYVAPRRAWRSRRHPLASSVARQTTPSPGAGSRGRARPPPR
jgi:MFS family permease